MTTEPRDRNQPGRWDPGQLRGGGCVCARQVRIQQKLCCCCATAISPGMVALEAEKDPNGDRLGHGKRCDSYLSRPITGPERSWVKVVTEGGRKEEAEEQEHNGRKSCASMGHRQNNNIR